MNDTTSGLARTALANAPAEAPTALAHTSYRPDIDGLRGIAVSFVVAFHAFPAFIRSGFIGVDVFFVISGFLISGILFNDLERGSFSLVDFYARRMRRIFPALLAMLVACLCWGIWLLLSHELQQIGKHVAAGAGFVSNLVLWGESGYFDNAGETKPLLHLWSLGIEEQFYLVWPLMLGLAWRLRLDARLVIVVVFTGSFWLNLRQSHVDVIADFYSPQTRFWELLAGALVASLARRPPPARLERVLAAPGFRNAGSALGVVLLLVSCWTTKKVHFPGLVALGPVLGTVLLIAAGPQAWVNRVLLSNRILVMVGLISFPLYLWHWPLLSFARVIVGETPPAWVRAVAVVTAFALAWASWRWVERPLRFGGRPGLKAVGLVIAMVLVGAAGWALSASGGRWFGHPPLATQVLRGDIGHLEFHRWPLERYTVCTPKALADQAPRWEGYVRCLQSKPSEPVDIVLLGDSHAEHLFIGLAEQLPTRNLAFYIQSAPPFVGRSDFDAIHAHVLASPGIRSVVLTMFWTNRASQVPAGSSMEEETLRAASRLADAGKQVYLTDDVPSHDFDLQRCAVQRGPFPRLPCETARAAVDARNAAMDAALADVVRRDPRIRLIHTRRHFCDAMRCSMVRGGDLLYRDSNHLNILGSRFIGERIVSEHPELR
ncbi:acyltransferase family protein [Rhizobacter sp. SG703]|uniref:acyltransferase family protein n=1 Tax=Rhizobacter sp. SG703 TaxID=2587140 RepID=UPI0014483B78|nr:acyltransferase family protein [Rhizobacter sp. SG703]NKI97213.1 peptidoglycan/LPS O-acetylase OafA/YrhL [Rhizobacter sp. SG703]